MNYFLKLSLSFLLYTPLLYANSSQKIEEKILTLIKNFNGDVGFYLKDLETGKELRHNADLQFMLGSTYKVLLMATCFDLEKSEKLNLKERFLVPNPEDLPSFPSPVASLSPETRLSLKDFITFSIISSDPVATEFLEGHIGGRKKIQDFLDKGKYPGFDIAKSKRGEKNYLSGSAEAMGKILNDLAEENLVSKKASFQMLSIMEKQLLRQRIPSRITKEIKTANKTGTGKEVTNDVGILWNQNKRVILAVYTRRDPQKTPRWDAEELIAHIGREVSEELF